MLAFATMADMTYKNYPTCIASAKAAKAAKVAKARYSDLSQSLLVPQKIKIFAKVKTALAKVCLCIRLIYTSGMGLAFLLGITISIENFLSFQIASASGSDKYFFVF
jgi:hypothetical protein